MQLKFRPYNDNRTTGIVDTLTEKVLAKTSAFTFEHIGQRLQRTLIRSRNCATTATVVKQRINRLLKHTLFIPDNDFGRPQFHQTLETIIAVDNPTVQIVQVGSRKPSPIQRHQWSQFRRQNRNGFQNHPFGTVTAEFKSFYNLEPFGYFFTLGFARRLAHFLAQAIR